MKQTPDRLPYALERMRKRLSRLRRWTRRELRPGLHAVVGFGSGVFRSRRAAPSLTTLRQRAERWVACPGVAEHVDRLPEYLSAQGIRYVAGRHALYVPPQARLADVLGTFVSAYPAEAGFKFVREAGEPEGHPGSANGSGLNAAGGPASARERLAHTANGLYVLGLGPRLYDVAELSAGNRSLVCLVVEHVEGGPVPNGDRRAFDERVRRLVGTNAGGAAAFGGVRLGETNGAGRVNGTVDGQADLLRRTHDGQVLYVGGRPPCVVDRDAILRRVLRSTTDRFHFGDRRLLRGGRRYLYQSVPGVEEGKRDTERRWTCFSALMRQHGITVNGRVVFDVGCNAGMMLAHALADGAHWGMGWDRPEVAPASDLLQVAMGNTRTRFVGAALSEAYPLSQDVPDWLRHAAGDSIVFYLAVRRHIGMLTDLANLPWTTVLYEGHQNDAPAETERSIRIAEQRWGCRLLAMTEIVDGDSSSRPVALLVRDAVRDGPRNGR
ncbi:MAG: hypothetical protein IT305_13775 [Chloroflexi bacterium]|nr:hypothetical protein [Chloroflexota bacterium]